MKSRIPSNAEILGWNPMDMEAYWTQSQHYDKRPFDTHSIMGGTFNQYDSEHSFALQFKEIATKL